MDTFNILAGVAGFIGLGINIYSILNVVKQKSRRAEAKGKKSTAIIGDNATIIKGKKNKIKND